MNLASPFPLDGRRRHPSALMAARTRFAHRSEQMVAALLDLYGIAWTYEPTEFPLQWGPGGVVTQGFRPDFWLPEPGTFIEITTADQRLVTRKNAKVRRFRVLYPEIPIAVLYQRDVLGLLSRHGLDLDSSSAA